MGLTLLIDDKRIDDILVTENYTTVSYSLDSGDHSVFWILDENDWVQSDNKARLRNVSFTASAKKSSGGGSVFLLIMFLFVLLFFKPQLILKQ